MKIILITLKKILFWSYERGSWQYDVMCVLILAFIFLAPNRFFQSRDESRPRVERGDQIGKFDTLNTDATEHAFRQRDSNATSISSIERVEERSSTKPSPQGKRR